MNGQQQPQQPVGGQRVGTEFYFTFLKIYLKKLLKLQNQINRVRSMHACMQTCMHACIYAHAHACMENAWRFKPKLLFIFFHAFSEFEQSFLSINHQ